MIGVLSVSQFSVPVVKQIKQFSNYDLLGWYSTSSKCVPNDIKIHQQVLSFYAELFLSFRVFLQIMSFNESPLYLVLDPVASATSRELPITVYESEIRILGNEPTMLFSKVAYKIETEESERIAVDHVAHVTPTGSSEGSQCMFLIR